MGSEESVRLQSFNWLLSFLLQVIPLISALWTLVNLYITASFIRPWPSVLALEPRSGREVVCRAVQHAVSCCDFASRS